MLINSPSEQAYELTRVFNIAASFPEFLQNFDLSIYVSLAFFFGIAAQFRAMDGCSLLRKIITALEKRIGILYAVVAITVLFSPFILNDVLILILTPVLVKYSKNSHVDIAPLLVAEITFTNVASSLTPLGNPQNILLWQASGISAVQFVMGTWFPLAISGLIAVAALYSLRVKPSQISISSDEAVSYFPAVYLLMVAIIVFSANLVGISNVVALGLCFLLGFIFTYRSLLAILKEFDLKSLLILYILIASITVIAVFIKPVVGPYANLVAYGKQPFSAIFVGGVSNIISNVPATQLILSLASISPQEAPKIAVEAGLAGNIGPISSFANIIALLMVKRAGLPIKKAMILQLGIGIISFLPAFV